MTDGINIDHLAHLAKLALDPTETAAAQQDLANIIEMIDQMQALDTSGVEPLAHPLETHARLRRDEVSEVVDRAALQQVAPATEQGYYLVPQVIESA